jgi:hypothetical protein
MTLSFKIRQWFINIITGFFPACIIIPHPLLLAQSNDFSIHVNSGLFSFGGESAASSSFILVSDVDSERSYTNNPYGTKNKLAYGFAAQFQRMTTHNLIFAIQSAYEVARSEVEIIGVSGELSEPLEIIAGETIFENQFLTLHAAAGRRFNVKNLDIDVMFGPEIGLNTVSHENGEAETESGFLFTTDRERNLHDLDVRLRSSITVYFDKLGLTAGYSYGLTNYSRNLTGANRERFSRFIRFGIAYRFM